MDTKKEKPTSEKLGEFVKEQLEDFEPSSKILAVADHPYYPEIKEFEDVDTAGMWLAKRIIELSDGDGNHEGHFYLAEVNLKESYNVLY